LYISPNVTTQEAPILTQTHAKYLFDEHVYAYSTTAVDTAVIAKRWLTRLEK